MPILRLILLGYLDAIVRYIQNYLNLFLLIQENGFNRNSDYCYEISCHSNTLFFADRLQATAEETAAFYVGNKLPA